MIPLDRTTASFYMLPIYRNYVFICRGLAAILNAKFLPAPLLKCAELPYHILLLIVAFEIAPSPLRGRSGKSLSFYDRKSDAPSDIGGTVCLP